jgi:HAD superfamily hydrolase (TIGR01490 family)
MPRTTAVRASEPLPAVVKPGEAAFFDVDNTLMRGASLFHVGRKMYQRRVFTLREAFGFARKQVRFMLQGENLKDVHSVRDAALTLATGLAAADIRVLGEEVYDEMIESKIWPGTRALTEQHMKSGRPVWLVTGTPVEVASVIADRLHLTGALGTVSEIDEGLYTGRLVGEFLHGPAKAEGVKVLAKKEGLDLDRCWAYSDSYNDVPLLSLVGHPVAINPDSRLRRHARDRNWPIYDFRSGRRAATLGLKGATIAGGAYGLWRGFSWVRSR